MPNATHSNSKKIPYPLKWCITLSCNTARDNSCWAIYDYVIAHLPECKFKYVREISKNGKYHVHGIAVFANKFDYLGLMRSRDCGPNDCFYDVHIHYSKYVDTGDWERYMYKDNPLVVRSNKDIPFMLIWQDKSMRNPRGCIPKVQRIPIGGITPHLPIKIGL